MIEILKHAQAILDYTFDFRARTNGSGTSDWLEDGEVIATQLVTVPIGLTLDDSDITHAASAVTIWVSGGTEGQVYEIACRITTNLGRTEVVPVMMRIGKKFL